MSIPAAVERSRSGNGAHIWFFFDAAIPAGIARKMGCYLITDTMTRRHQLRMDSYDRLFPNQDTLPRGGFGNLIALPLQRAARRQGNSVFVDEHSVPHPDQWAYLASVQRIGSSQIELIAREANGTVFTKSCPQYPAAASARSQARAQRRARSNFALKFIF